MAKGVQGQGPCYSPRASAERRVACASKHPPARGVADAPAAAQARCPCRASRRARAPGRSPRPGSARSAGPGGRYASPRPCWAGAQAEEVRAPTIIRGRAHDEHRRRDRARSQRAGQGCAQRTAVGGCGLAPRDGARYGWRAPSRRRAAVWKEGGAARRPARHRGPQARAIGPQRRAGAAPSRAGWEG